MQPLPSLDCLPYHSLPVVNGREYLWYGARQVRTKQSLLLSESLRDHGSHQQPIVVEDFVREDEGDDEDKDKDEHEHEHEDKDEDEHEDGDGEDEGEDEGNESEEV